MWSWSLIAFGIFGGIILWELSTGLALDNNFRIRYRRPENPNGYWRSYAVKSRQCCSSWRSGTTWCVKYTLPTISASFALRSEVIPARAA